MTLFIYEYWPTLEELVFFSLVRQGRFLLQNSQVKIEPINIHLQSKFRHHVPWLFIGNWALFLQKKSVFYHSAFPLFRYSNVSDENNHKIYCISVWNGVNIVKYSSVQMYIYFGLAISEFLKTFCLIKTSGIDMYHMSFYSSTVAPHTPPLLTNSSRHSVFFIKGIS